LHHNGKHESIKELNPHIKHSPLDAVMDLLLLMNVAVCPPDTHVPLFDRASVNFSV